jgi:putative transposase
MVTPAARREAISLLRDSYAVSERRACRTIGSDRSSARYRSRRAEPRGLVERIRELARAHPRLGYRRQTEQLRAEGFVVNAKRVLRLRRQLGLEADRGARSTPARPKASRAKGAKWAALREREGARWRG